MWQMERHFTWYVTFQSPEIFDHYDGKTVTCSSRGLSLHLNAYDRITVKARVHWLPIWVTNDDLSRVLESRGDIKSVQHVTEKNIITGVREVVFSMREGDQNHLPYLTSVHGHRCLLSIPGRPPICFKCEGVGHLRHQCPHGDRPVLRSYASAVQGPVVSKRGGGLSVRLLLRLLASRRGRSHRAPLVTRGSQVVPRRAWLPFQPTLPKTTRRTTGVPMRG